jgi:Holliday junction resolvasome RuvABC endonuclease subunit
MKVLVGIDPGLANFGFSFVELLPDSLVPFKMSLITTDKSDKKLKVLESDDNTRRGREVAKHFRLALEEVPPPLAFCIEAQSFPRNASSAAKTAISWGIIISIAERMDAPIFQVRPQEIKYKLCGGKSASKQDVQDSLDSMFGAEVIRPLVAGISDTKLEHPYDSVGAVVACADSDLIRMMRRMS